MCNVKSHIRKGKNKATKVRQHSRKDKVSSLRGSKEFSTPRRKKLAERGKALPDGSFPIESKRDLANAITSVGRAGNQAKARAWVKKRAKVLGGLDMIPQNWK